MNVKHGYASATMEGDQLIVSTGKIERCWKWTGKGFATTGFKDVERDREWADSEPCCKSDWQLAGLDVAPEGKLVSIDAKPGTDEGFTTEHLAVTAEIAYDRITVKYVVWAYPGTQGLRTQLWVKGKPAESSTNSAGRVDVLPVNTRGFRRLGIGYYNQTQQRHKPETHMIRDESVSGDSVDWASVLCLEDAESGIAMVKESHKCVNQAGVNTGEFILGENSLVNTGTMLRREDLVEENYRPCWASWLVVYGPGNDARELAIKEYDRIRFPVNLNRDMYIKANTWGSGDSGRESRDKATEVEVLKEIDSVADLGIDGLQIDDGWQKDSDAKSWKPDEGIGWKPHPSTYPEGWKRVKAKADEKGIRLGIWAPSERISLDEMKWNYDHAGFWAWKLDFAGLDSPERIVRNIRKVREFLLYTDHKAQAVWDVTENPPRYGYFWAREYGCSWLSNRKPNHPPSVIPKPWLMLRESWELVRYINLNKFELPVKNFKRVNREVSDAWKHSDSYAVALGLVGIPVFFQTTYYYEGEARDEVRNLLSLYKEHREKMFTSYVFAIGDEPTNASWAGFQWYHPDRDEGYLLIFRERKNEQKEKQISLRFLSGCAVRVTNLRTEEVWTLDLDHRGSGKFSIENPADFLFCRYEKE